MSETRVRFAPSPTGHLHIGSARTALFNWLFARSTGGKLILRIEDTDLARSKKEYLDSILRDLQWLGLDWDEGPLKGGEFGPYFQTQRLSIYKKYALELIEKGKAYYCFCSPEELEREKADKTKAVFGYSGKCANLTQPETTKLLEEIPNPAVRFKVEPGITKFKDIVRGEVEFNNDTIDDFVIMKQNGMPVYNFAAVVDDYLMKITHIIRGDEHISNTPRQIIIAQALEFDMPHFAHIPIVLNPDKTKLSKRAGASNLLDFENLGYLPQGLVNFLALLGISYGDDADIMDKEEIVKKFTPERIINHPAVFDDKKLDAVNAAHIRTLDNETLAELLKNFGSEKLKLNKNAKLIDDLTPLYKDRIKTLKDFFDKTDFLFGDIKEYDASGVQKYFKDKFPKEAFEKVIDEFLKLENFNAENTENIIRQAAQTAGLGAGKLIHPIRLAASGRTETAGLFEILEILGKEKVIERMKRGINLIT